jgi:hypothetical protein
VPILHSPTHITHFSTDNIILLLSPTSSIALANDKLYFCFIQFATDFCPSPTTLAASCPQATQVLVVTLAGTPAGAPVTPADLPTRDTRRSRRNLRRMLPRRSQTQPTSKRCSDGVHPPRIKETRKYVLEGLDAVAAAINILTPTSRVPNMSMICAPFITGYLWYCLD